MRFGQPQLPIAIGAGEAGQLRHRGGIQAARRHAEAHPVETQLALGMDTDTGTGSTVHQVNAVVGEGLTTDGLQFPNHRLPIGLKAQLINQIHQTTFVARHPIAMAPKVGQHRQGEGGKLLWSHPKAQGHCQFIALGREETSHHHREAQLTLPKRGEKGQIVVQQETVGGATNGHVELARQVAGAIGSE